jgi:hypothetical protein
LHANVLGAVERALGIKALILNQFHLVPLPHSPKGQIRFVFGLL